MSAGAGGAVAGGLGLALLLVGPGRLWRLAGLATWACGWATLLSWLEPDAAALAWAALAGGAVVLAVAFLRLPWLLPVAILAAAPFHATATLGAEETRLPVALYAVGGGAALALAWQLFWEIPRQRPDGGSRLRGLLGGRRYELGPLAWPLALLAAWLGLGVLWSDDERAGAILLALAVLPFGVVAAAAARLPRPGGWTAVLYAQLALMGLAFAGIGVWQYLTRDVIVAGTGADAGETLLPSSWFHPVDAVHDDPASYARFLVVAILASLVLVLFARRRLAWAALATAALTWAGLLPSFSQSAYVALAAGIGAALAARWTERGHAVAAAGLAALALAAALLAIPAARDRLVGDPALVRPGAERPALVQEGTRIALDHPLAGVGTGGLGDAYAERIGLDAGVVSQNAAVTLAAENGLPGLALLAWLAVAALLWTLGAAPVRDGTGLARLATGLALLAILVQSLFTDALLDDPLLWGLLGVSASFARRPA